MNQKALDLYESKKFRIAIFGLTLAFIGAIFNIVFQNFNVAGTSLIESGFAGTLLAGYVLSVLALSLCEFVGGILMMIFNTLRRIPIAEYGRALGVKSSRTMLLSALVAGPIGTACSVMAISMCGSTYANCVIGLTPVFTAIFGVILLKEKAGPRVWIGIVICVVGMLVATMAPPEGVTNFYLGIAIAFIAPLAFTAENMISVHVVDVVDPEITCPLYRMVGSAIIEFIVVFAVCAVTGNLGWIALVYSLIFGNPLCILFLFLCGLCMAIQYNSTYVSYTYCGAIKAAAILWTGTFWTIPVGFAMSAMHILDYSVTSLGIIGAVVVVVGIMLVVAKPKELFDLRNN